jgi:hypothetical protein
LLAQILPGFRDFRTPLVTGYLWLLSTWILLGKPVPTKDRKDGLMGTINALSEYLSPALVLGGLSFIAYIIGILLAIDLKFVTRVMQFPPFRGRGMTNGTGSTLRRLLEEAFKRAEGRAVTWEMIYKEFDIESPSLWTEKDYIDKAEGDPNELKRLRREGALFEAASILTARIEAEIPTLATKLQEKNKDLYDSYSRDKSEAEFRLSVALPIAAASVLVSFLGLFNNPTLNVWVSSAGFIAAAVLFYKGWKKSHEATNIIITVLDIDVIKSRVLERLDALQGPKMTKMADGQILS